MKPNGSTQWSWLGFALLCVLTGSTWLSEPLLSSTWPPLLRLCFHDAVVFVALLGSSLGRRSWVERSLLWPIAGWAAILFALPAIVSSAAGGTVRSATELLAIALVPALTVFILAQRSDGDLGNLMPAVIGVGGLALVVPFAMPSSSAGYAWLCAILTAAVVEALAAVRLHALLRQTSTLAAATVGSGAAALLSLAAFFLLERGPIDFSRHILAQETGWGLVFDVPLVLLTIWLLRSLGPVAFSTRFLLVPVVTILGGMLMIRPAVSWTTWLGLALVAGASWIMLRDTGPDAPPKLV